MAALLVRSQLLGGALGATCRGCGEVHNAHDRDAMRRWVLEHPRHCSQSLRETPKDPGRVPLGPALFAMGRGR